jgi:PKD repeat protein
VHVALLQSRGRWAAGKGIVLKSWTAGLLVTAALALPAWAQVGPQSGNRTATPSAKAAFPAVELPERAHGQRALDLLGARLPEVAAWYGKSTAEFASILRRDGNAWLDRQGRLFYQEDLDAPLQVDAPSSASSLTASGGLAPLDQTFLLHSRPGSRRTIFLNFRGATLSNTAWNTSSQPTITALPFDTDGVPYSFSTAELERIQYIWQRVAEDYAPFEVDVTTEAPSADRLSRSGSGDDVFGTTVLITKRTFYSCSCGGVAYISAFDDTTDYYKPALVFYDALGAGNEKYVAEAISHEAGHNVGLHHDGTSKTGYYSGHGSGATGWAPIMGVGYYKELVQWSKGEYPDANNKENDFTVMASNGLAARADDHGNTNATASRMAAVSSGGITTLEAGGFIERTGDVDVFSFVAGAGSMTVNVAPARRSPNLDISAELRDSAGVLLASGNPVDNLNASLSVTGAGGTYFVWVTGVGKGDLTTGYSDYSSLGEYSLAVTVSTPVSQPPVAAVSASPLSGVAPITVAFSSNGSYDPDGTIVRYEWNFGDGSAPVVAAGALHTYANPGKYTASLKVTDDSGLTDGQSVTVNAQAPVAPSIVYVDSITVSLRTFRNGNADATAQITVRDGNGNFVPGAAVAGAWSGAVSGTASAVTGSNGVASMKSGRTKAGGSFTFTVTGISLSGYTYDPSSNKETSDSASR